MRIDLTKPIYVEWGSAVLDDRRFKKMSLSQLDINSHSTFQVLRELQHSRGFDLTGKGVIALGSHDYLEHDGFFHYGAASSIAVECNPYVIADLKARVGHHPQSWYFEHCLWSESGLVKEFHFFKDNKYGAGSLFADSKLSTYVPECKELSEKVSLITLTFNDLVQHYGIQLNSVPIGWVSLDVQGSELEVLKGASTLMDAKPEVFYVEVSWDNLYEGAPLIQEIDDFFLDHDYQRIGLRQDIQVQGDAIYVKK